MADSVEAFRPTGSTVTLTAGAASTSTFLPFPLSRRTRAIRIIVDPELDWVYWASGGSDVTASAPASTTIGGYTVTASDTPIYGGMAEAFNIPATHSHIAVIAPTGSGVVRITPGVGE